MTWETWVNSPYHTLGAYIETDSIYIGIGCSSKVISSDGSYSRTIKRDNYIIQNEYYTFELEC